MDLMLIGILIMVCLLFFILLLLLSVMVRVWRSVSGFLGGNGDMDMGELPNLDFEKVGANLMYRLGTQLLDDAQKEKGGLLGMIKSSLSGTKTDKLDPGKFISILDKTAGVKPGLSIDATHPAPKIEDLLQDATRGRAALDPDPAETSEMKGSSK